MTEYNNKNNKEIRQADKNAKIGVQSNSIKSKTQTHYTIPQQYENKKPIKGLKSQKLTQKSGLSKQDRRKQSNKNFGTSKAFKKLYRQSKCVKNLQEQYGQLQQQLRQMKECIQLQLQLIKHDTQTSLTQLQVQYPATLPIPKPTCKHLTKRTSNPFIPTLLQVAKQINLLFEHNEYISKTNSNYLILSQINKEQEGEYVFILQQLQERIKGLRFLLNNKEDLLAYQVATLHLRMESTAPVNDTLKKVMIDYQLPKKQSINKLLMMQGEYQFVTKIVKDLSKLRNQVKQLQKQQQKYKKEIYESINQQSLEDPISINPPNISHLPQNISQVSKYQNSLLKSNIKGSISNSLKLLPLNQNHKQSLLYKVGKLQQCEVQKKQKLEKRLKQLEQQYLSQKQKWENNVRDYQLKQDIYKYKYSLSTKDRNKAKQKIQLNTKQLKIISKQLKITSKQKQNNNILQQINQEYENQQLITTRQPQSIIRQKINQQTEQLTKIKEQQKPQQQKPLERQQTLQQYSQIPVNNSQQTQKVSVIKNEKIRQCYSIIEFQASTEKIEKPIQIKNILNNITNTVQQQNIQTKQRPKITKLKLRRQKPTQVQTTIAMQ